MPSETEPESEIPYPPADQRSADEGDLIVAALDHIRGGLSGNREAFGSSSLTGQEASLLQWADSLGLLLNPDTIIPFDVTPCQPGGGFLEFIEQTLAAGNSLRAVRTVTTGS